MSKHITYYLLSIVLFVLSLPLRAQENTDSVLDIYTCQTLAIEHNHKLRIGEHQLNIAINSRKSAFTRFFPSLDATAQYMRTNKKWYLMDENVFLPVVPFWAIDENSMSLNPNILDNPLINGIMIDPTTGEALTNSNGDPVFLQYGYIPSDQFKFGSKNLTILNAGATQPIYLGGKLRAQYRIAKISETMQKSRIAIDENQLIKDVENIYWQIISLEEKEKLAQAYKTMLDTLVRDIKNLKAEGIVTGNELLKARSKQNEVELQLYQAQNGVFLARMALNQKIGYPLDTIVPLNDDILPVRVFSDRDAMIQSALQNRPELEMLDQSIALADQGIKLAWSRFLPIIVGTANYSYYNPNPYNGFQEEFGGDWNIGITCRIPITQWGDRFHTLNSAKELKAIAELKRDESKELIALEVQQSWNKYLESFKKVEVMEIGVTQAEENLRIQRDKFKEGMIKTADLLEAQALWQESASKLLDAKTELRNCEIEIKKTTGQL